MLALFLIPTILTFTHTGVAEKLKKKQTGLLYISSFHPKTSIYYFFVTSWFSTVSAHKDLLRGFFFLKDPCQQF